MLSTIPKEAACDKKMKEKNIKKCGTKKREAISKQFIL